MEKDVVLFFLFLQVARTIAMRSIKISHDDLVHTNAKDGSFPFMISLQQYFPDNNTMIHKCGGVIIGPDHALTASSCSSNSGINTANRVISGSVDLASGGFLHMIRYTSRYHKHYHNDEDYNLAVIKVTPPFDFRLPGVNSIQMVESHEDDAQFISIGWGATEEKCGHNVYPKVLQVKQSKLASKEYCDSFYIRTSSREVCTQNRVGEGLCTGDEGGPLVFVSKTNDMFLVGIANRAHYCGTGFPDTYTKVWAFKAWIDRMMNMTLISSIGIEQNPHTK